MSTHPATQIQPMFGLSTPSPLFAQFTVTGKVELFQDEGCLVHINLGGVTAEETGYIRDGYELLSFCYLRNLNIVPLGLGRMQLVPRWRKP